MECTFNGFLRVSSYLLDVDETDSLDNEANDECLSQWWPVWSNLFNATFTRCFSPDRRCSNAKRSQLQHFSPSVYVRPSVPHTPYCVKTNEHRMMPSSLGGKFTESSLLMVVAAIVIWRTCIHDFQQSATVRFQWLVAAFGTVSCTRRNLSSNTRCFSETPYM